MQAYDKARMPVTMEGNVFLRGAKPCKHESNPLLKPDVDPAIKLMEQSGAFQLELNFDPAWAAERTRKLVTTELLDRAKIPDLPYETRDGTPLCIDTDYFGAKRNAQNPFPGPFELSERKNQILNVWPVHMAQ